MNRIRAFFTACTALMVFGVAVGVLGTPRLAVAQQDKTDDDIEDVSDYCDFGYDCELESYTVIFDTSNPNQLNVFAATYVNEDALDDGYSAYVCASAYQDATDLADGCTDDDGIGDAELSGDLPLAASSDTYSYSMVTDSYLADWWDDLDACDDGDPEFCFYIVSTGVDVTMGPPQITSISPPYVFVGTGSSIAISGESLVNPFGGSQPDVSALYSGGAGSGLTLSGGNFNDSGTHGTVSAQAAQNATTGAWDVVLQYMMGSLLLTTTSQRNGGNALTVGDPTPSIMSVSQSSWAAGSNSISITITGTGFGTNPNLTITGPGVTYQVGSKSDTSIQTTVSVDPCSAGGAALIQVQSTGYTGAGFTPAYSGQSSTGSYSVNVTSLPASTPQIMFNGQNIAGTTQTVMAGQQIALSVATPGGCGIQSQSWSFSNQTAITGGFVNGAGTIRTQPSASAGGSEAADPPLNQNSLTFYWVNPGDNGETVTCTYTLNNGQSASATATFNIGGPTGNLLPNAFAQSDVTGTSLSNAQANGALLSMTNSPTKPGVGVFINDNAQPVSNSGQCPPHVGATPSAGCGQFIWVQILNSVNQSQIIPPGQQFSPLNASNQLDGTYPYAFGGPPNATWDSPGRGLLSSWGEAAEPFTATMYALWDPALPAGCTPAWTDTAVLPGNPYIPHASTCTSTPIPLGSVQWHWSACAINAGVSAAPSWFLQCGVGSGNSGGAASGYPEWSSGTGPGGCSPSDNGNCQ